MRRSSRAWGAVATSWPCGSPTARRKRCASSCARGMPPNAIARAKHRLLKLLLRHGQRSLGGGHAWTVPWWQWVQGVTLPEAPATIALHDYLAEVTHQQERVRILEAHLTAAVAVAPPPLRTLITGLPALRGIRLITAATLATEIGSFARF